MSASIDPSQPIRFPSPVRFSIDGSFAAWRAAKDRDRAEFARLFQDARIVLFNRADFGFPDEVEAEWQAEWAHDLFRHRVTAVEPDPADYPRVANDVRAAARALYMEYHRRHTLADAPEVWWLQLPPARQQSGFHRRGTGTEAEADADRAFISPGSAWVGLGEFLGVHEGGPLGASLLLNDATPADLARLSSHSYWVVTDVTIRPFQRVAEMVETLRTLVPILSHQLLVPHEPLAPPVGPDQVVERVGLWAINACNRYPMPANAVGGTIQDSTDTPDEARRQSISTTTPEFTEHLPSPTVDGPLEPFGFRFGGVAVNPLSPLRHRLAVSLWDSAGGKPYPSRPASDVMEEVYPGEEEADAKFKNLCHELGDAFRRAELPLTVHVIAGKCWMQDRST